jgi:hypothetical protein
MLGWRAGLVVVWGSRNEDCHDKGSYPVYYNIYDGAAVGLEACIGGNWMSSTQCKRAPAAGGLGCVREGRGVCEMC